MITLPLPANVYLDTSLIVDAINAGSTNSTAAAAFIDRLVAEECRVHFSQIVWLELSEAIRKLATIPGRVTDDLRERFHLDDWASNAFVRRRWMRFGTQQFAAMCDRFLEVFEHPFNRSVWERSLSVMIDYQMRSHDAVHVATAREKRLACIATTDQHFRKITDLDIRLVRDH